LDLNKDSLQANHHPLNVLFNNILDQASRFSAIGPSRSTIAMVARNNYLNGEPASPKSKIIVSRNLNQIIKGMSSINCKG